MDVNIIIKYWVDTSEQDYKTMENLYKSKDYHWCLFIGHLVIEKLIKAIYIKVNNEHPPKTHDLLRLAEEALVELNKEQEELLDMITTFNISVRYPDYKQSFYKKCTKEFTFIYHKSIKELRVWLKEMLKKE